MSEASPRDTYRQVADAIRRQIKDDPEVDKLPPVSKLQQEYGGVSRTLINRALNLLKAEGILTSAQGSGWRVLKTGEDRRPLAERMLDVFAERGLEVGAAFPSEDELCRRFDTSRTPVRAALAQLEGAGWLSRTPGKPRVVVAVPPQREDHQR